MGDRGCYYPGLADIPILPGHPSHHLPPSVLMGTGPRRQHPQGGGPWAQETAPTVRGMQTGSFDPAVHCCVNPGPPPPSSEGDWCHGSGWRVCVWVLPSLLHSPVTPFGVCLTQHPSFSLCSSYSHQSPKVLGPGGRWHWSPGSVRSNPSLAMALLTPTPPSPSHQNAHTRLLLSPESFQEFHWVCLPRFTWASLQSLCPPHVDPTIYLVLSGRALPAVCHTPQSSRPGIDSSP